MLRQIRAKIEVAASVQLGTLLLASGLLASTLLACVPATSGVAFDGDADLAVVERSKAVPPVWAALPPGSLAETVTDWRVLTVRNKLLNLPLGLQQTQRNSLDATVSVIAAAVQAKLLGAAHPGAGQLSTASRATLQRLLSASVDTAVGRFGKVADIYYEGIDNHLVAGGDPMAHYYAVYILVIYPKDKLPDLYRDLAERLISSDEAALRSLGGVAAALAGPAMSAIGEGVSGLWQL